MRRRARRRWGFTLTRPLLLRMIVALLFTGAAGWLVVAVSGAAVMRTARPDLALSFFPSDARAAAQAAEQMLTVRRPSRDDVERAYGLSRDALRRDATVVAAWRTLGVVAALRNRPQLSAWFFRYSERLSHRDLLTQLWLIEDRVAANDIPGTLLHYDAALRATPASYDLLIPILVSASTTDGVVRGLAPYLAANPPWAATYLSRLAQQAPPGDQVVALLESLRRLGPLPEPHLLGALLPVLAERREFAATRRAYSALTGEPAAPITNGSFERPSRYPPVDWQLGSSSAFGAEPRQNQASEGTLVLHVYATAENGGPAARQMLALAPGRYELRSLVGGGEAAPPRRLSWRILCGTEAATVLLDQEITPRSPAPRPQAASFTVPAACPGQWLQLEIAAGEASDNTGAWVDAVRIRRLDGASS